MLALAALLRAAVVAVLSVPPESDYLAYYVMASNLLNGHGLVDTFGNHAYYNPGYPLFILAPVFWLFGKSLAAAQAANVLLGVVSTWLVWRLGRRVAGPGLPAVLAALLWATYVEAIVYAEYLAKENLMIPLMLAALLLTLWLHDGDRTLATAALLGAIYGGLALVGSAGLFALPLSVAALLRSPVGLRSKLTGAAAFAATLAIVLAPWLARNAAVIGAPVLNTNGGFNLYIGNNPAATGYFVSIADTPQAELWHRLLKDQGEVAAARALSRLALEYMHEHRGQTVRLALQKGVMFWTPPWHERKGGNASAVERAVRAVWLGQFCALGLLALSSLRWIGTATPQLVYPWLFVVGYTAVHMVFFVIFRYRLPIIPVVTVLAAYSLTAIAKAWMDGLVITRCGHAFTSKP